MNTATEIYGTHIQEISSRETEGGTEWPVLRKGHPEGTEGGGEPPDGLITVEETNDIGRRRGRGRIFWEQW